MTFKEFADSAGQSALGWSVVGGLACVAWLVRRIFTNQKQIEMTRQSMENMCRNADRDRVQYKDDMAELKTSQRDMARDIKQLFQR